MRRLILVLLFLTLSVWLALQIIHHPGDLFLVVPPWTIQMPIWFAILMLLLLFGIFYLLINGIDKIYFIYFRIKNWLRFRREHQSFSKTQRGLTMLIEERWLKAEKLLLSGLSDSIEPLMNYLGAAKAAHHQAAYTRRNTYLQKAYQVAPNAKLAIGLTQAELEVSENQLSQALATLTQLRQFSPRHPRVLSLLEKTYIRLADWKKLASLLPLLRKTKVISGEEADAFEKNVYVELIQTSLDQKEVLQQLWKSMPRSIKKNPQVVLAYVKKLLALNEPLATTKEIETLIHQTLKLHWQKELVYLYVAMPPQYMNANRQLVIINAWTKIHGQQAELLFALGKICMRIQLWGKAKDYFEKSLSLHPCPLTFLEYGRLLETLKEPSQAIETYRLGLTAMTNST